MVVPELFSPGPKQETKETAETAKEEEEEEHLGTIVIFWWSDFVEWGGFSVQPDQTVMGRS